eukprot:SAG11_NODE_14365_length_614_cov_2.662136_1_plen_96_part_10
MVGEGSEWCIQFDEIETSPEDSTLTPALFHKLTGIELRGHIIDLPAEMLDGLSMSIVLGDIKPCLMEDFDARCPRGSTRTDKNEDIDAYLRAKPGL